METPKVKKQIVVLYDSKRGSALPYDTAYDGEQLGAVLTRCKAKHGEHCNARGQDASR